ncbi:uncharacterized protein PG998_008221 [Apiospora kogelbergensis]|uniref:uncharacterized protein n=1 Tax=Apiospora kogelbergensis TaxID=1337665 RepID=UPI003130E348
MAEPVRDTKNGGNKSPLANAALELAAITIHGLDITATEPTLAQRKAFEVIALALNSSHAANGPAVEPVGATATLGHWNPEQDPTIVFRENLDDFFALTNDLIETYKQKIKDQRATINHMDPQNITRSELEKQRTADELHDAMDQYWGSRWRKASMREWHNGSKCGSTDFDNSISGEYPYRSFLEVPGQDEHLQAQHVDHDTPAKDAQNQATVTEDEVDGPAKQMEFHPEGSDCSTCNLNVACCSHYKDSIARLCHCSWDCEQGFGCRSDSRQVQCICWADCGIVSGRAHHSQEQYEQDQHRDNDSEKASSLDSRLEGSWDSTAELELELEPEPPQDHDSHSDSGGRETPYSVADSRTENQVASEHNDGADSHVSKTNGWNEAGKASDLDVPLDLNLEWVTYNQMPRLFSSDWVGEDDLPLMFSKFSRNYEVEYERNDWMGFTFVNSGPWRGLIVDGEHRGKYVVGRRPPTNKESEEYRLHKATPLRSPDAVDELFDEQENLGHESDAVSQVNTSPDGPDFDEDEYTRQIQEQRVAAAHAETLAAKEAEIQALTDELKKARAVVASIAAVAAGGSAESLINQGYETSTSMHTPSSSQQFDLCSFDELLTRSNKDQQGDEVDEPAVVKHEEWRPVSPPSFSW